MNYLYDRNKVAYEMMCMREKTNTWRWRRCNSWN